MKSVFSMFLLTIVLIASATVQTPPEPPTTLSSTEFCPAPPRNVEVASQTKLVVRACLTLRGRLEMLMKRLHLLEANVKRNRMSMRSYSNALSKELKRMKATQKKFDTFLAELKSPSKTKNLPLYQKIIRTFRRITPF